MSRVEMRIHDNVSNVVVIWHEDLPEDYRRWFETELERLPGVESVRLNRYSVEVQYALHMLPNINKTGDIELLIRQGMRA